MQSTLPPSNQFNSSHGRVGPIVSLVFTGIVLAISLFIVLNRQYLLDSIHFWSYKPTASVASIADKITLTDTGQFIFYAARPEVDDSNTFNARCGRTEQSTAVLGCYVSDRIYLYDVTEPRLDGIKEVTAAHEMLHAVYQRMSDDERSKINRLVEVEYEKISSDPEFADRMAFYARTEPGERDNELHSIIGTEVESISPDLEAHYAKYFTNRRAIVELHSNYKAEFTKLEKQADALAAQLDKLSKEIDSSSKQYNNDVEDLNKDILDFNKRATSGSFSSQAAFTSERQALQKRVASLNGLRSSISAKIDQYESIRKQYNETVTQSKKLYQSIDSTLAPAPSVQ